MACDDSEECTQEGEGACVDEYTVKSCVRGNSFDEPADDLHWVEWSCHSYSGAQYCISENEKYLTCSFAQEKDVLCPPGNSYGISWYCADNVIQYCVGGYVANRTTCPSDRPYCTEIGSLLTCSETSAEKGRVSPPLCASIGNISSAWAPWHCSRVRACRCSSISASNAASVCRLTNPLLFREFASSRDQSRSRILGPAAHGIFHIRLRRAPSPPRPRRCLRRAARRIR